MNASADGAEDFDLFCVNGLVSGRGFGGILSDKYYIIVALCSLSVQATSEGACVEATDIRA